MNAVLDVAIDVHRELGPGLLESAYEAIIADELAWRGHAVQRQLVVPIRYKSRTYDRGYRLDLLVDNTIVVEIKSADRHAPVFEQQVLTYLRGLDLRHGMVVNFGLARALDGINRVTNYRVPAHRAEQGDMRNGRATHRFSEQAEQGDMRSEPTANCSTEQTEQTEQAEQNAPKSCLP